MDFSLDDPLGDILSSDNSQDDSFFEAKKSKTKIQPKTTEKKNEKSSTALTSFKNMDDLFGISSSKRSESKSQPMVSDIPSIPKKTTLASPKSKINNKIVSTLFNDDDDIDLGFDPKKPKATVKSSILDDLLAPIIETKKTSMVRPSTGGPTDSAFKVSRQSTETTETSAYTAARPKTARKPSLTSNDPLSLFAGISSTSIKPTEHKEIAKDQSDTPKVNRKSSPADWLGLDLKEQNIKKDIILENKSDISTLFKVQQENLGINVSEVQNILQRPQTPLLSQQTLSQQFITNANLEAIQMQTLQHQDSQLIIATQMKNQEIALLEMQQRQQELLIQQESQFNELLQKQLIRQNQVEMSIKSQQERINTHIQLLMAHPPMSFPDTHKDENNENILKKSPVNKLEEIKLEHEVKRLELDKLRLEDLISNINMNHEKELDFMEKSHKKQIAVLQLNLETIETRFKDEIQQLQEYYNKKVDLLVKEKCTIIEDYELKLQKLKTEKEQNMKEIFERHENTLKMLETDHKNMLDNIRQSKLMEFSIIQENSSYLQTLRSASDHLESVTGGIQSLQEEIQTKIDREHKDREKKLVMREKKLDDSEKMLQLSLNNTETEKSRLIELVTTLEIQLVQLSKDSSEENWNYKQKLMALEVEKASFEKEKHFNREQINREQRQTEELKKFQIEEYQRMLQQLEYEKEKLSVEKIKLETTKKLEPSNNFNKSKIEIETSIKVAQDAARQADLERERYFKMQRELETRKRELIDHENEIRSKKDELENAIVNVKAMEKQLNEEIKKCHLAQQNFSNKTSITQQQIRAIAERESRLSEERLLLSKERFEIQEFKRKLEQNKCSLCKIGERSNEISNILLNNDMEQANRNFDFQLIQNDNIRSESRIDKLFDDDMNESLNRMRQININNLIENTETIFPNIDSLMHSLEHSNLEPTASLLDPDFTELSLYQRS